MKELWKDVKDFEGLYKISNFGKVKRISMKLWNGTNYYSNLKEKFLKPQIEKGYYKLALSKDKKRYVKYIHRLIAEAFIPNPNNYKEVNHKDSDPSNFNINNLEWCDRRYNIDYMKKHQEEIKDRHERRIEALEDIYYVASNNKFVTSEYILKRIEDDLLGEY